MKAPTGKSVLDGDLNGAKSTAVANEILNDMQRNSGGDTVMEDESRYQVTVHLPGATTTPDWTGEVTGPPQLFILKSVNVVAAGKGVVVLDKTNKKMWQATLTYPLPGGDSGQAAFLGHEASPYGEGPCVERGESLYLFDQAVLTAFDLKTGNARWRLPSVGVVGLFFDNQDNVYVNTTTGNPDDIRYSRQIDVTRKTESVVAKINGKNGQFLWRVKPGGFATYVSGDFIYVMESYDPNPADEEVMNDMTASLQKPAFMYLRRLRPSDGRLLWEYYRCTLPGQLEFRKQLHTIGFQKRSASAPLSGLVTGRAGACVRNASCLNSQRVVSSRVRGGSAPMCQYTRCGLGQTAVRECGRPRPQRRANVAVAVLFGGVNRWPFVAARGVARRLGIKSRFCARGRPHPGAAFIAAPR